MTILKLTDYANGAALGTGNTSARLSSTTLANKVALGFAGSTSYDDLDADDTPDYLAFALAIKAAARAGGATIQVPPGTYVIRRCLPLLYDKVKLVGMGATRDQVTVRNTYDGTSKTGFANVARPNAVQFGLTHPTAFTEYTYDGDGNRTSTVNVERCTSFPLVAAAAAGNKAVKISVKDATALKAVIDNGICNKVAWLCDVSGKLMVSNADLYKSIQANLITLLDRKTGGVRLARALRDALPAGARLYISGTGALAGRGPHRMARGIGIENMTLVSDTKHVFAECGAYESTISNIAARSRWGFMLTNCLAYSTVKNVDIQFGIGAKAGYGRDCLEIKGGSIGSTFTNISATCMKPDDNGAPIDEDYPNIAIGENSVDCVIDGLTLNTKCSNVAVMLLQTRNATLKNFSISMSKSTCQGVLVRRSDEKVFGRSVVRITGGKISSAGGIGIHLDGSHDGAVDCIQLDTVDIVGSTAEDALRLTAPQPGEGWIARITRGLNVAPTAVISSLIKTVIGVI